MAYIYGTNRALLRHGAPLEPQIAERGALSLANGSGVPCVAASQSPTITSSLQPLLEESSLEEPAPSIGLAKSGLVVLRRTPGAGSSPLSSNPPCPLGTAYAAAA